MCIQNVKGPFKATEDVVCYKHVFQWKEDKIITTYQKTAVKIGRTYTSTIDLDRDSSEISTALHSFTNIQSARETAKFIFCPPANLIVKCIIPKDSIYYVGMFRGKMSIASNVLKYVEIIERL